MYNSTKKQDLRKELRRDVIAATSYEGLKQELEDAKKDMAQKDYEN